ncbi:tripartite tricarboxylate transporter substrate binding protein [Ramlibacter sp. PS3R-8]|uniref:Bug family tripartite tricarboxylate transporter substrate binding protein n=1 Tax=Ramlibacter sp. PS3R-8 TaxID=3133437 RepID=UPI0030AE2BDF
MQRRDALRAAATAAALAALSFSAVAQEAFPARPLRIVVPFPAGGVVDVVARSVGQKLSEKYGQPVIVENRAGAGGSIGTDAVAKAAPDGYTMLMVGTGFTVLPQITKNLPWSPADFRGVLSIGSVPNIIVVPPETPVKTVGELIALARKSPQPLTYGSPGIGSSPHLSGELLAQMADVKMTHVPYKGQPEAMTDLLAGRISMMALSAALAGPHLKSGKLRAIGVTAGQRIVFHPEIPTVAESASLPAYDVRPWTGVFVPAKTPEEIVRRLAADMTEVLKHPDVKARMDTAGMELNPQPHVEFDAFIAAEGRRWAEVMRKAGITAQ